MGMIKICDLSVGREMRVFGVPLKRRDGSGVSSKSEIEVGHPSEGTVVRQLGVDHTDMEAAVVTAVEQRIVHLKRSVARCEVKRDGLVVPKDAAMAKFEMIDGEGKESLDESRAGNRGSASRWKIGGAVGIESHVDDGLLENDFIEAKLGTDERTQLQTRDNAVCMGQRHVGGRLAAVDRDIAHIGLQAKGRGVDAAYLDTAAGDALQFGDETAADE